MESISLDRGRCNRRVYTGFIDGNDGRREPFRRLPPPSMSSESSDGYIMPPGSQPAIWSCFTIFHFHHSHNDSRCRGRNPGTWWYPSIDSGMILRPSVWTSGMERKPRPNNPRDTSRRAQASCWNDRHCQSWVSPTKNGPSIAASWNNTAKTGGRSFGWSCFRLRRQDCTGHRFNPVKDWVWCI